MKILLAITISAIIGTILRPQWPLEIAVQTMRGVAWAVYTAEGDTLNASLVANDVGVAGD